MQLKHEKLSANGLFLSESNTVYKSLRPKQVVNSELRVTKVTDVIENRYISPFDLDFYKDDLVNISFGTCLPQNSKL